MPCGCREAATLAGVPPAAARTAAPDTAGRWAGLAERQRALAARLGGRGIFDLEAPGTVVVLPSLSFPPAELAKIDGIAHYEERLLCLALLLRTEGRRIVYVTSAPVDPAVVEYHLGLCPDPESARRRLHLVALGDGDGGAPQGLSAALLGRPDALARVRALGDDAVLLPFNVTPAEGEVADALGLPLYGARPDLVALGSKTGSRRAAAEAGVAVPAGAEGLSSVAEVEVALASLRERRPGAEAAVVKLNDGFSGQGSALLDLGALASPLADSPTTFCAAEETWPSFAAKIAAEGAVAEELLRRPGLASPSVQLHAVPGGALEVVSTHDQVLGGPDAQVYLGCRFPASAAYRGAITNAALRVGRVLAGRGVVGPFACDFVVAPEGGAWRVWLTEVNLRMGGTTHPFQMARLVTGASYDPARGELVAPGGRAVAYVASDNLKSPRWRGLQPKAVVEAVARRGLAYDPARGAGVTLHLLGALPRHGKLGATAVAGSTEEADLLRDELVAAIDALAAGRERT